MILVSPTPSDPTIDATVNPKHLVDTTTTTTEVESEIESEIETEVENCTTTTLEETTTEPIITTESSWKTLGVFKITAYDPCVECSGKWGTMTSTGVTAKAGRTIAVDPRVIPYGSEVRINGHTYIAEDCGGAIKGNVIDIYFDTHEEAKEFGVQYAEVELFTGGA